MPLPASVMSQSNLGNRDPTSTWWGRNAFSLGVALRIIFGIVWLVDGIMKFVWLAPSDVVDIVRTVAQGQPSWLAPWFNFWVGFISSNGALVLYGVGLWELILGFTLVFGLMRKLSYLSGILLSLLIYTIDEGFGGPYGPGSTDIGAAIIYLLMFVALIALESTSLKNRLTLDSVIERRNEAWRRIAEFAF